MARDGFKIFDSDTHVGPYAEILDKYLAAGEKQRLQPWEAHRTVNEKTGHVTYTKGQRKYRRTLGTAKADETPAGYMAGFTGVKRDRQPSPRGDNDPAERIKDLDYEGVDVNLTLPSGWFGTWTSGDDVPLEMAMYRAYHRWMSDYCGAYPRRLGGVIERRADRRIDQEAPSPARLAPAADLLEAPRDVAGAGEDDAAEPLWIGAAVFVHPAVVGA
ncbi:MAG TPA: hypothetical protein VMQ11_13875, partial [Alphaproteobacteria bacterium]|nr:hypothetical protein [Alphaproteobacteria bacterium]